MQDHSLYYTAPSEGSFNDMKENAMKIWQTYDDSYGYASEKIDQIKDIENLQDNFVFMFSMFDISNQKKLISALKLDTRKDLRERLASGGTEEWYLLALGL